MPLAYYNSSALLVPDRGRDRELMKAIGSWGFCAHEFSDDELVHAAFLMLQHALALPELDNWRLPAGMALKINLQCKQCTMTRDLT